MRIYFQTSYIFYVKNPEANQKVKYTPRDPCMACLPPLGQCLIGKLGGKYTARPERKKSVMGCASTEFRDRKKLDPFDFLLTKSCVERVFPKKNPCPHYRSLNSSTKIPVFNFDRKKTTKNNFCLKKSLNSELSKINNSCRLKAVRFCEVVFFLRSSTHSPPTPPRLQPSNLACPKAWSLASRHAWKLPPLETASDGWRFWWMRDPPRDSQQLADHHT